MMSDTTKPAKTHKKGPDMKRTILLSPQPGEGDPLPVPGGDPGNDPTSNPPPEPRGPSTGIRIWEFYWGGGVAAVVNSIEKSNAAYQAVVSGNNLDTARREQEYAERHGYNDLAAYLTELIDQLSQTIVGLMAEANDPPQLSYDRAVAVPPRPVRRTEKISGLKSIFEDLIRRQKAITLHVTASLDAMERMNGALQCGDFRWVARHARDLAQCAEYRATLEKDQGAAWKDLMPAMEAKKKSGKK